MHGEEHIADFLADGGDAGRGIRGYDWDSHPLGLPVFWPQALKTAVRLMLTIRHPAVIFWGPELFTLYNDMFAQMLEPDKRSAVLGAPGRQIWTEIRCLNVNDIEGVMAGTSASVRKGETGPTLDEGEIDDRSSTWSYSPIDHDNGVGGVLALCTETAGSRPHSHLSRLEQAAQQQMFEQAPGLIIILRGSHHEVTFVNDAHQAIYNSAGWVGKPIGEVFLSSERQGFLDGLDMVYRTGEVYKAPPVEVRYRRAADAFEETVYLAFLYAPLCDEQGDIAGIFCEGLDVTGLQRTQQRTAALAAIEDLVRNVEDPDALAYAAAEILGRELNVSRAGYGTIDKHKETIHIDRDWNAPGIKTLAGVLHFRDYGSYIEDLKRGEVVVCANADEDPRTAANAESLKAISAHSFVNMPVTEQGGFVALLYLNHAFPRPWTAEELDFIRQVADRTRTAVERRRAEAALTENEARLRFLDSLTRETAKSMDADAVLATTTAMVGAHLRVTICAYADMEDDEDHFTIRGDWNALGSHSIRGYYSLAAFGALAVSNLHAGIPLIIRDCQVELAPEEAATFRKIGVAATICMPLIKEGRLRALMAVHDTESRHWTERELALLGEVAERSWAHIERVRSEKGARDIAERLRLATDAASIGTWDYDLVRNELNWDARCKALFGLPADAAVSYEDTFLTGLHHDDRDRVDRAVRAALTSQGVGFQTEYRTIGLEDRKKRWLAANGNVLFENGKATRFIGTLRDISARKKAERHLKIMNDTGAAVAAELNLEKIVQTVTDASVELSGAQFGAFFYNVLDTAGGSYMLYALSGALRSAFENYPMPRNTEIFAPTFHGTGVIRSDDILTDPRYGKNAPNTGMPAGHLPVRSYLAVPVVSRSGEVLGGLLFGHEETGRFMPEHEQALQGIAGHAATAIDNARLFQKVELELAERRRAEAALQTLNATLEERVVKEVAERSKAEDQLRQVQKMEAVGQLTGGIAHDFNNMLAVVIGGLNILQRRLQKGDYDVGRFVEGAMDAAQRAAGLTQRLLAFSRRQPLSPAPLGANRLVAGMSDLLVRTLGETIRMETVLAAGLWDVNVDAGQLESALLNLCVNARDAMPDGGRLTIETSNAHIDERAAKDFALSAGQFVLIAVTDTGTGMTPDVMSRAFDPFYTTKDVGKGTGLGLSQVYGFVRQSGGNIKIYSEVGVGSTIKIYLPRHYGEAAELPPVKADSQIVGGHADEIIMVVEDEERVRAVSAEALRELGYTVIETQSPFDALKMIEDGQPVSLLFTDVVMPGMSGRMLVDRLLVLDPQLKVLYTTGYTRNAIVHNGILEPGTQLLTKPFSIEELASKVRRILDQG